MKRLVALSLLVLLLASAACGQLVGVWSPANGGTGFSSAGATPFTGAIFLIVSGSCPSYATEVTALNGVMLEGTIHTNGDVGNTGGSNSIAPTGTVSQPSLAMNAYTPSGTVGAPTFTGNAGTVPAETFTGNAGTVPAETFTGAQDTTSAVSAGTPAGTNGASATSGNCAATNIAAGTGSTTACKATAPNLTVPAETFTGSALGTHTHTVTPTGSNGTASFTPAGTNSTASFTPAGTNSAPAFSGVQATLTGSVTQPSFTGNAFDPHPAFMKVIFCSFN